MTGESDRSEKQKQWLARGLAILLAAVVLPMIWASPSRAQPAQASNALDTELQQLNERATILYRTARYPGAENLWRQAMERSEQVLGADHMTTLYYAAGVAMVLRDMARYEEAEALLLRVVAANERTLGSAHINTVSSQQSLGVVYLDMGRYIEAEAALGRAWAGLERSGSANSAAAFLVLQNIGNLYRLQGRYAEAEAVNRRSFDGMRRELGPGNPLSLLMGNNLADLYRLQGRYNEAETLLRQVIADNGQSALQLTGYAQIFATTLAETLRDSGNFPEATALFDRVIRSREQVFGALHPTTLNSVQELASAELAQSRFDRAEPLFRRAWQGRRQALGASHPDTISSAASLTETLLSWRPGSPDALAPAQAMLSGLRDRRAQRASVRDFASTHAREQMSSAARFALYADAAWTAARPNVAIRAEAFRALQDSVAGAADRSIAQHAARRYANAQNTALSALISERQRLEAEAFRLDGNLASAFGEEGGSANERSTAIRSRLDAIQARVEAIDTQLRADAPDYFALISPTPLTIEAAQQLLAPNEALFLVVPSQFGTHVVTITRETFDWRRSDWNADRIRSAVARIRRDIGARSRRDSNGRIAFDRTTAYQLYREIFGPAEASLPGITRVYVAAGGSLAALPFSLLVTAAPEGSDSDPSALRATRWLGDTFALIHIPSIQSLATLRQAPRTSTGRTGFLGVGDPVLADPESAPPQDNVSGLFRSGRTRDGSLLADVAVLRRLRSLPGTARELEAVRAALNAPATSLLMRENATEPNVRAADLSSVRTVLFATHGLTASEGNLLGVRESGLVLTPPAVPQDGNDGFLSASEVTTLRLNADWAILSACNTATGDGVDGEGLGSLARSFFYAGARNLLASHWLVSDEVAPFLIRRTLELAHAGTSRADALRQAMREIRMDVGHDTATDSWAHPFYWAAFVLIGDESVDS